MKKIKTTIYITEETYQALSKLREIEGRFMSDIIKDMAFNRLAWAVKMEKERTKKYSYNATIKNDNNENITITDDDVISALKNLKGFKGE